MPADFIVSYTLLDRSETSSSGMDAPRSRGLIEQGERTDDGLRREAREEVGLELADPALTRIVHETLTDGSRARHGYFAQFIARAQSTELRPGHEVIEARWFDGLPRDMAFRDDYLEDFRKIQAGASF